MNGSLPRFLRPFLAGFFACLSVLPASAGTPADAAGKAAVIGQPTALQVQPQSIVLTGGHAHQQLVVTGRYAGGTLRDLTGVCELASEAPAIATVDETGFVTPKKNGSTALVVKAGGQNVRVPVTVQALDKPHATSFRNEVIAALNVGGCNAGACHGTPSGKNGFKLSLRGFDPAADYIQLTRDVLGRRTDRQEPDASLILQKALGRVPHEGGAALPSRQRSRTRHARLAGRGAARRPGRRCRYSRASKSCPVRASRSAPARWQQLTVMGHFADGSVRDVTRLTVFSSSDSAVADVNSTGLVEFKQAGEVAILCRYPHGTANRPADLSRTASGLRLAQPAGEQLRR